MGVGRNRLQWGLSVGSAWFILLAGGASLHVVLCEVFHVFSLIGSSEEVYGIGNA